MDEKEKLAYSVLDWLNKSPQRHGRGGCFNTPYGILRITRGKHTWEHEYLDVEELPAHLLEKAEAIA